MDDHPVVRQGLAVLLRSEDIGLPVEAGGLADALAHVEEHRPDLAIVDLSLEGEDGLPLVADLHKRAVPVLVYSMHGDLHRVVDAFSAGALGYVTKRELASVVLQAIREVMAGRRFVSPGAAAALLETVTASRDDTSVDKLSPRERAVYELLGRGDGPSAIAAALHISPHTVESYFERILVKLSVNGMQELRRHAARHQQKRRR
ncbi:MAG: response regulator [Bryobacteraceae bacterium]